MEHSACSSRTLSELARAAGGLWVGDNRERITRDGTAAFSFGRGGRQHAGLSDRRLRGQKARRAEQELYLLHGRYAEWAGHAVVL